MSEEPLSCGRGTCARSQAHNVLTQREAVDDLYACLQVVLDQLQLLHLLGSTEQSLLCESRHFLMNDSLTIGGERGGE